MSNGVLILKTKFFKTQINGSNRNIGFYFSKPYLPMLFYKKHVI